MSNHDCGCGGHSSDCHEESCGCGQCQTIVVSLDGEGDTTCNIIGAFGVAEMDYVALQPVDSNSIMIFRYAEEEGGIKLDNIESDDEYKMVLEAFEGLFEDDDFDDDDFDFDDDELDDDEFDFDDDDDLDDDDIDDDFGFGDFDDDDFDELDDDDEFE